MGGTCKHTLEQLGHGLLVLIAQNGKLTKDVHHCTPFVTMTSLLSLSHSTNLLTYFNVWQNSQHLVLIMFGELQGISVEHHLLHTGLFTVVLPVEGHLLSYLKQTQPVQGTPLHIPQCILSMHTVHTDLLFSTFSQDCLLSTANLWHTSMYMVL